MEGSGLLSDPLPTPVMPRFNNSEYSRSPTVKEGSAVSGNTVPFHGGIAAGHSHTRKISDTASIGPSAVESNSGIDFDLGTHRARVNSSLVVGQDTGVSMAQSFESLTDDFMSEELGKDSEDNVADSLRLVMLVEPRRMTQVMHALRELLLVDDDFCYSSRWPSVFFYLIEWRTCTRS